VFLVIEEDIKDLSDNKIVTKNNQEFILVFEKQIAANHIKKKGAYNPEKG
jgi:hypothetical protein